MGTHTARLEMGVGLSAGVGGVALTEALLPDLFDGWELLAAGGIAALAGLCMGAFVHQRHSKGQ